MWDAQAPDAATSRSASARATGPGTFPGDHDLWRLPQADDRDTGHARPLRLATARSSTPRPPGQPISPNLVGRVVGGVRAGRPGRRRDRPGRAPRRAAPGAARSTPGPTTSHPPRPAGHRAPPRLLPGVDLARRHGARRRRDRPAPPTASAQPARAATCATRRTGRAATSPARARRHAQPVRHGRPRRTPPWPTRCAAVPHGRPRRRPATTWSRDLRAPDPARRRGTRGTTRSAPRRRVDEFDVNSHTFGLIATVGALRPAHAAATASSGFASRAARPGCSAATRGASARWSASASTFPRCMQHQVANLAAPSTARRRSTSARWSTARTAPATSRAASAASRTGCGTAPRPPAARRRSTATAAATSTTSAPGRPTSRPST